MFLTKNSREYTYPYFLKRDTKGGTLAVAPLENKCMNVTKYD